MEALLANPAYGIGRVANSIACSHAIASSRFAPHMLAVGRSETQTFGLPGWPKIRQRLSSDSCAQRTPAGLPSGMPGIGDEIDGAMQQAPQPWRQGSSGFCMSTVYLSPACCLRIA